MKDFKKNNGFGDERRGGGRFEKKSFGGRPSFGGGRGGFGGGRDFDRPMHKAKCDDCGKMCEVPFRPTGEKPVYCNDCFGGHKTDAPTSGFAKRDYGNSSYEKPAYSKPAYSAPAAPDTRIDELKRQLEVVNTKLDKLMSAMESGKQTPKAEAPKVAPAKVEAPKEKAKPAAKKVATKASPKKVAPKKAAAKKK